MWRGAEQEECLMVEQHAIPPSLFPLFSTLSLSISLSLFLSFSAGLHVRFALFLLHLYLLLFLVLPFSPSYHDPARSKFMSVQNEQREWRNKSARNMLAMWKMRYFIAIKTFMLINLAISNNLHLYRSCFELRFLLIIQDKNFRYTNY